jgi:hypothetical protein
MMRSAVVLTRADIHRLFALLNTELAAVAVEGEIFLVGGAVMCLAFDAREATRDVDALLKPAKAVREAAARVAAKAEVPPNWLNDAVKGFLGSNADFDAFLEFSNLRVFVARPEYLLAMKCVAMRFGEDARDVDDVRYLLRYLNIGDAETALALVTRYFDEAQIPPKTRFALEELLPDLS